MKRVFITVIAFSLLIQCSGGKETIDQDSIVQETPIVEETQPAASISKPAGTESTPAADPDAAVLALLNSQTDSAAVSPIKTDTVKTQKQKPDTAPEPVSMVPPVFDFYLSCGQEYNINSGDSLFFYIEGDDSADVIIRLFSKSGDTGKLFTGIKSDNTKVYALAAHEVSNEIGTGDYKFIAEIYYNAEQDPVKLQKMVVISDKNLIQEKVETDTNDVVQDTAPIAEKPPVPVKKEPGRAAVITGVPSLLSELAFDDIFFDYAVWKTPSLSFNSNYIITLGKIAKSLRSDPAVIVILTGHTDNQGSSAYNNDLALKRTATVAGLITGTFKSEERNTIAGRIELCSTGADNPLFEAENQMKNALNRRVSIKVDSRRITGMTYATYLQQTAKPEPESAVVKAKPAVKPPVKKQSVQTAEERIYNKAYELYQAGNHAEAGALFEDLLLLNPRHKLADNAQYWLGEIEYSRKSYTSAINMYQKVFGLGDKNKEAYAQLRLGYCYYRLKQPDDAKREFNKVITNYPKSDEEIKKAKYMLSQLHK